MNTTRVDQLTQGWLAEVKVTHPGIMTLAGITENFFSFMFNNTKVEQMEQCTEGMDTVFKYAGVLAMIFAGFAAVAGLEVCVCCFGSCEAWQAKDAIESGPKFAGEPLKVVEEELRRQLDDPEAKP